VISQTPRPQGWAASWSGPSPVPESGVKGQTIQLVEERPPSRMTDEERDDAKQVLALAIMAIQRERAAADQFYVRGRNFLAFIATLFVAGQAALVATIGREARGRVLLSSSDLSMIRWPAAVAAGLLLIAFTLLMFWVDRPRRMDLVGSGTLSEIWVDDDGTYAAVTKLEALVLAALEEESCWARTNSERRKALTVGTTVGAAAALAVVVELVFLYMGLT
jgi:hypothetical protein